jgi:hypothetical protein
MLVVKRQRWGKRCRCVRTGRSLSGEWLFVTWHSRFQTRLLIIFVALETDSFTEGQSPAAS